MVFIKCIHWYMKAYMVIVTESQYIRFLSACLFLVFSKMVGPCSIFTGKQITSRCISFAAKAYGNNSKLYLIEKKNTGLILGSNLYPLYLHP